MEGEEFDLVRLRERVELLHRRHEVYSDVVVDFDLDSQVVDESKRAICDAQNSSHQL